MSKINELASQLTNDPLIDELTDLLYEAAIRVLSTYLFLLMSFPHSGAFLGSFKLILHEKRPKKHASSPLFTILPGFPGLTVTIPRTVWCLFF